MTMWELFRRFRPAGTPGAAAPAGVPADAAQRAGAELGPLFTALAPDHARARELRADATARAAECERRAAEEAGRIVAGARRAAQAARAEAFAAGQRDTRRRAAQVLREAHDAAAALRDRDRGALDRAAELVVRAALSEVEAAP